MYAALLMVLLVAAPDEAGPVAGDAGPAAVDGAAGASAAIPVPDLPRSEPPDVAAEELSLGWTLVRTMVVLGLVVGLAWLVLNVGLRKLLGIKPVLGANLVQVLERVPLDQKRTLFVVEAAGEVLLLGGGEGNLSLITKLDAGQVKGRGKAGVQASPLAQALLGRAASEAPAPATEEKERST